MKVVKLMLAINGVTLVINGTIVWLTIVNAFPPILGIVLFLSCLVGLVWFSCLINGSCLRRDSAKRFTRLQLKKWGGSE